MTVYYRFLGLKGAVRRGDARRRSPAGRSAAGDSQRGKALAGAAAVGLLDRRRGDRPPPALCEENAIVRMCSIVRMGYWGGARERGMLRCRGSSPSRSCMSKRRAETTIQGPLALADPLRVDQAAPRRLTGGRSKCSAGRRALIALIPRSPIGGTTTRDACASGALGSPTRACGSPGQTVRPKSCWEIRMPLLGSVSRVLSKTTNAVCSPKACRSAGISHGWTSRPARWSVDGPSVLAFVVNTSAMLVLGAVGERRTCTAGRASRRRSARTSCIGE